MFWQYWDFLKTLKKIQIIFLRQSKQRLKREYFNKRYKNTTLKGGIFQNI